MLKKYQILFLMFLSYVIVLSFYPAITSGFINLDDPVMVVENPNIKSLSFSNIKNIFSSYQYKLYHPIVTLSYAIEYCMCKTDPYLYHVDNILLHLLNVYLVFFVMKLLSKSFFVGFISAIIFALHPTRVESVTWVSARKDTLFTFFFLSSIFAYININKTKYKKFLYGLALLLFLMSCMSKPTAVTLPVTLILIDFYRNEFGFKIDVLKKYIPFFVISLVFSYVAVSGHYSEQEKAITTIFVRSINFFDAHLNYLFYIYKFFLPINLSCFYPDFYDHNNITPNFVFYSTTILYLLILVVIASLKINKKIFFGFFFFFITLLPSSGILPTGIAPIADRYTYIPYIGLAYIVAELLFYIYKKNKILKYVTILTLTVIIVLSAYLTYQRNILWSDNKELMTQAINYAPETADQAYLLRGIIYKNEKNLDLAQKDLEKSYFLNSQNAYTAFHIGHLKQEQGDYLQAKKYYSCIPYTNVNYASAINNIGLILDMEGDTQKAINFMEKKKNEKDFYIPDYFFGTLAAFYYKEKDFGKTIENLKNAIALNPYKEKYYIQLMTIYELNKDFINFEKTAQQGIDFASNKLPIINKLADYLFEKGKYEQTKVLLLVNLDYCDDFGYFLLGNIFAMEKEYKKALFCYTMAILLTKDNGEYFFKRAVTWYMLDRYDLAKKDVEKAEEHKFVVDEEFKKDLENTKKEKEK